MKDNGCVRTFRQCCLWSPEDRILLFSAGNIIMEIQCQDHSTPVNSCNQPSSLHVILFSRRRAAVTPMGSPRPQEGLRDLSRAMVIFWARAMVSTWLAPRINAALTLQPFASITAARPASTAWPSPPIRPAGVRGVASPPSCSGHRGIQWWLERKLIQLLSGLHLPS